jgi:hypothetical protein
VLASILKTERANNRRCIRIGAIDIQIRMGIQTPQAYRQRYQCLRSYPPTARGVGLHTLRRRRKVGNDGAGAVFQVSATAQQKQN